MSKKIISNTMIFVIIIAFVKMFEVIFTPSNTLVGVTVIIAILILIREDLTKKPVKNFIILLLLNIGIGIFSHISSDNMWIGLILNFVALSSIGYSLSFRLNKVMIVPFGLQYLFLLYTPVVGDELGMRLLSLAFGAVLVMVVQFIIHRKSKDIEVEETKLIKCDEDKQEYKIHPVRASYAIRIGIVTAISVFLVSYFNIEQGRWVVYTVFSLTELYSEHCKIRSKQRLEGTVIGALIILVLFIFIKDIKIRSLIVLSGGYLDTYTTNYKDKMICVTMSVVASVSLANGTLLTSIQMIICVFIGIILALAVDKLVFRQKLSDIEAIN